MTSRSNRIKAYRQDWSAWQVRLELGPVGIGNPDGFWWPHSRDLVTELAGLLPVLRPGFGPARRVAFRRDEWTTAPRGMISGGLRTLLDGYRHMPARTVDVIGVGATLTLRLITPVAGAATNTAQHRSIRDDRAGPEIGAWLRDRHRRSR
ncbi:hypothetical protein HGA13_12445 [Nocardia speluncae]|uniref:Uncharacterized protein n=1 Tax=Nocardia speluncae TaxID=419477 RepID=A0A846XH02_9NOCA|nr:DUF5994 family protein [Nocardia speluncae]NKY33883.1 hypothetical protein [Nocardia speluncae]